MKKKILWVIIIGIILFGKLDLKYEINMDVQILSDSSAIVTEVWDVQTIGGKSWCKEADSLRRYGYNVSDYEVYMDDEKFEYVGSWFPNTIFGTKSLYGYKNNFFGLKLCFGANGIKRHKFTIKYEY